jgi:triosephosphate isomerase
MRKKIVAGNWKMNKNLQEAITLAKEVKELAASKPNNNVEIIVAPPFVNITKVVETVSGSRVQVSAQNCATEAKGAFTGEVSAEMIKSTGANYVIIGHSERRAYYHEDDTILLKKVKLALENNLTPIFCCGEVLSERESNIHFEIVRKQLAETIFNLNEAEFRKVVIAYEPVWAIGTGKTATSAQAQEIHKYIRGLINQKYGASVADDTTILYGGSCNASNAKELFANADVDGGLIGGASLKAQDFLDIVYSF